MGGQRGQHAGNQSGIMHDSHRDHFHGENGGGHGRAEDGGESGAHTAHNHNMLILLIHAEGFSKEISNASSQLQSRAFPAGGASEKVGDQSGEKDQGSHPQGNFFPGGNGCEHQIRSFVVLIVKKMIEEDDGGSSQGKEENQPGPHMAGAGNEIQAVIEGGSHKSQEESGKKRKENPF